MSNIEYPTAEDSSKSEKALLGHSILEILRLDISSHSYFGTQARIAAKDILQD
jgi:hypothetical protein